MRRNDKYTADMRAVMTQLFRNLRTNFGFIAKQRAGCCGSCIGYELGSEPKNHGRMCAFTTAQDDYGDGELYIKYGFITNAERAEADPTFTEPDDSIPGRMIAQSAEALGMFVEWNGDGRECIHLYLDEEVARPDLEKRLASYQRYLAEARDKNDGPGIEYGTKRLAIIRAAIDKLPALPDSDADQTMEHEARQWAFVD